MRFFIVLVFISSLFSCTHEPINIGVVPTNSTVTYTPNCKTCASTEICPVVDDIAVNNTTTYKICSIKPADQGTFILNSNNCGIWTSNSSHTDIILTCIAVCTNGLCDTTIIKILPPVPDNGGPSNSCHPDSIYFSKDVLDLITSSCAYTGCHNAASAKDGVILNNYTNIIRYGKVKPGKASESALYQVITTTSAKNIMPPPPAAKLSASQIAIIQKWINQGAQNNTCSEGGNGCDVSNVSFVNFVKPALASCVSCHTAGNTGGGINLDSYAGFKSAAQSGKLFGSINWSAGFKAMPTGGTKLSDCTIKKVKAWIDAGALNN
jgi:uncharacterized membrane protein